MGKLRACLVVALAACGSSNSGKKPDAFVMPDAAPDAKVWMDAPIDAPPNFDFTCVGNTAPTTASANVTVSGTVTEIGVNGFTPTFTMLQGATVDVCKGNCTGSTNKLATSVSDASGAFSDGPFATGGTPVDGYLKISPPTSGTSISDAPALEYPADPITMDLAGVPTFTATTGAQTLLNALCGQNWTTQGALAIAVTDCANMPISDTTNVTLVIKQGGSPVAGTTTVDLGQFSAMAKGTFLICSVPPNATTSVGATYMKTTGLVTLRAHDVAVVAGNITATQVRPGY